MKINLIICAILISGCSTVYKPFPIEIPELTNKQPIIFSCTNDLPSDAMVDSIIKLKADLETDYDNLLEQVEANNEASK